MCERRRRERNFGYILRETRIFMPFLPKDGGHDGPHLQKVGGQSKKMGAIGPLAPAYFHRWVTYILWFYCLYSRDCLLHVYTCVVCLYLINIWRHSDVSISVGWTMSRWRCMVPRPMFIVHPGNITMLLWLKLLFLTIYYVHKCTCTHGHFVTYKVNLG